ncbi:MAG: hypothetical protein Q8P11_00405 [bacterium]|nr:hypothetical protein [bacterium]
MNPRPNIYLFHGSNTWSIHQKTKAWIGAFEKKYGNMNSASIDLAGNVHVKNILPIIQKNLISDTLFSTTSFLHLRGLFSKTCPPEVRDMLSEKLPSTSPTAFVVLEDEIIDKRLGVYKILQSLETSGKCTMEEFEIPTQDKLKNWILSYLKQYDMSIEPLALALLLEHFDPDHPFDDKKNTDILWVLSGELHKLVHFTQGHTVHRDDVEILVCAPDNAHIFNFVDAILAKQKSHAYELAHALVSASPSQVKSSVINITGMLRSQLRSLVIIKSMKQTQLDEATMAKQLGWNPKRVWVVSRKTSNLTLAQLTHMYRSLLSFDEYIKLYSTPADASLDILIAQLVG